MKKTVLIVHNYYQIPGGEDSVVMNEKKLLEENGHKVILYTRNNSELKSFSTIRKLFLPITTVFNPTTYRDIRKLISQHDIEIIHVHNTLNIVSPAVYYAAVHAHIPIVQTIHNFRLLCPAATFYRNNRVCEDCLHKGIGCAIWHGCYRKSKIQTAVCVISMAIHRATKIYGRLNYITLTEFNKQKLFELKQIDSKKVFVKPNFVQYEDEFIPYAERKDQFVFAGRLDALKGVEILLKAWELLKIRSVKNTTKLVICGTGPLEEWCHEYVKEHELKDVEFKGFVQNQIVKNIIGQSKALILPTQWYEGFPMSIVEAISQITPVVGSDIGNVGNIITNDINGWKFKYDSPDALCNTLLNVHDISGSLLSEREKYKSEENYMILSDIYDKCI